MARETNENTNGLVDWYLLNSRDVSDYSQDQLEAITDEVNNRPRKTVNAFSPPETCADMLLQHHAAPDTTQKHPGCALA